MSFTTIFIVAGIVLFVILVLILKLAIRWVIKLVFIGAILFAILGAGIFWWWSIRLTEKPRFRQSSTPARRSSR